MKLLKNIMRPEPDARLEACGALSYSTIPMSSLNILSEAAGLPVPPGRRADLVSKKNDVTVLQHVDPEQPRFLVYSDQGTLRQWLALRPELSGTRCKAFRRSRSE
jgi:hypothetical protein